MPQITLYLETSSKIRGVEAAQRVALTRLAVWGSEENVAKELRALKEEGL